MQDLHIDIAVEAGDWPGEEALLAVARGAMAAAWSELNLQAAQASELSLLFTDDAGIRDLNARWRGTDKATNVLSFPAFDLAPGDPLPPLLGDVALAAETVCAQAELENKVFDHHMTHLLVHGFLHLLGYDHEEAGQAEEMEAVERRILARLGIADPYDA